MNFFRCLLGFLLLALTGAAAAPTRPNILWLTSEDHGPHVGCYGDAFATTPTFDRLARMGLRYRRVWSGAPVCAPARTTLISGVYPAATGSEHMRSLVPYPRGQRMYPQFLRDAGYHCSNNSKTDYNLAEPGRVWDESSPRAHWRTRAPGQPFFAVFNSTKSHESQIRTRPHLFAHDPAGVRVPAYHPDTPEVRRDWAQYHDQVTAADSDAARVLAELEADGLLEDTIIFHYADHGSGMPRNKRWAYNAGLQVPLVVVIPEKFRHLRPPEYQAGGVSDRLVGFVDFAPTLLNLLGMKPPAWMQGRAFLGPDLPPAAKFLHGYRARMDERIDLTRSVTDGRHVYIRNFMPHRPQGQYLDYMFQTPTTRVWRRLFDEGKLNAAQAAFWQPKPPEELYDLENDPDEVRNLADSPAHRSVLKTLREELRRHAHEIRDVSFLPEGEMHRRSAGGSPYDMAREPGRYPFERVFATAERASSLKPEATPKLLAALADADAAVRWWAAQGFLMRGPGAVRPVQAELRRALEDASPDVRIAVAEALAAHGDEPERLRALAVLVPLADAGRNDVFTAVAALNALDLLEDKARPVAAGIQVLPADGPTPHARYQTYVPRLVESLLRRF